MYSTNTCDVYKKVGAATENNMHALYTRRSQNTWPLSKESYHSN